MRLRILAADSMGVRSLALAVETSEGLIVIDPGASLAPRRFGLPPHELEKRELELALDRIRDAMGEASVVVITHYHYDHYIRGEPDLYRGKLLIIKHPRRDINRSQAIRSYRLLKKEGVAEIARDIVYGDSQTVSIGRLRVDLSPPVWHGYPGTRVGRVIMVRIVDRDESLVYTSDVQGPADPAALEILRSWSRPRPRVMVVDGPPTYFAGFKVPVEHVEEGLRGMAEAVRLVKPEVLVVDHHLLRDIRYAEKINDTMRASREVGVKVLTAASYMGVEERLLEARRRELWREG